MSRRKLTKNTIIVFAATFVSSLAAFVFQIMMGRAMSLDFFGQLNALLSIQIIFSIPTGALILLYTRHSAHFWTLGEKGRLKRLYSDAWRVAGIMGICGAILIVASSIFWMERLSITSFASVAMAAVLIAGYFLQSVPLAFVRGLQKFYLLGAGLGFSAVLKVALAALFIYMGITVSYAILAIFLAVALSFFVMHFLLKGLIQNGPLAETGLARNEMLSFALKAMAGGFLPTLYINIDMILIRSFFAAELSGFYAALMVVGKIIFLCGQVVAVALFPATVSGDIKSDERGNELVFHAMLLTFLGGGMVVIVSFVFSSDILEILFKIKSAEAAELLPYYCASVLAVSLIFIEAHHRLARQQYGFLWIAVTAAFVQVAGIYYFSGSLISIVKFQAALFWTVCGIRFVSVLMEQNNMAGRKAKP